jgi:hypothetical protein
MYPSLPDRLDDNPEADTEGIAVQVALHESAKPDPMTRAGWSERQALSAWRCGKIGVMVTPDHRVLRA